MRGEVDLRGSGSVPVLAVSAKSKRHRRMPLTKRAKAILQRRRCGAKPSGSASPAPSSSPRL